MAYFNQLPKTKFLNQDIVNLAVGVKLNKLIKGDAFALLNYAVKDGESPDTVAYNYYDDPSYAWLVLLSNNIIDPYFEWPLSVYDFNQFIKKKYGSIAAAQATTMHCEHKTKDLTVSADSLTVSNGVSSSDYDAIDAYTYWDRVNENRRFIKLVNRSYLPAVIEQFNNLV
tara:strand:+ start:601 stop:1110 length:510 start_codon:yes stop_codon:yes gene_type:complete